ncbi:hypothetical protein ACIBL3_17400 [Kribbella sp. NPDC050124]|uniref:hypothetical protein n=1 Tax=Kribbella sp. NPDC050124 TaxID=3364114 RepID=UPI0037B5733F
MRELWRLLQSRVDRSRYATTLERFDQQAIQATLWRDSIVSYYFEARRVLDQSRSWAQVRQAGDGLLLGGTSNLLRLTAGNASPQPVEMTARVAGWTSEATTVSIPSREFVSLDVPVTPPHAADHQHRHRCRCGRSAGARHADPGHRHAGWRAVQTRAGRRLSHKSGPRRLPTTVAFGPLGSGEGLRLGRHWASVPRSRPARRPTPRL